MTNPKLHPAVGIDLGTTYSAVAHLDASGRAETIRNSEGGLTTPSAVFFDRTHPIVGLEALEAGLEEPDRLALYAKRDVGEMRYEKEIRGEWFPPEVLQALMLMRLKADAELRLGPIEKAVVTVPAFFNEPCRKATQDAGRLAGLEVLDIINEPTAAAITYGVEQGFLTEKGESKGLERVLVYDLGGGTFDVTVMEIDGRNYHTIATAGDVYLGGVDWDERIVDHFSEAFMAEHGIDPRLDPCSHLELSRKATQAKHALTQRDSTSVTFATDQHRMRFGLTQVKFAEITADLVERTLMTVRLVLDDAAIAWSDLTRLILVGGSTRMPMILHELEKQSGMTVDRTLSPDEAVCHGAAIYAGILLGHGSESFAGVSVTNVNSHDLGVLAVDPVTGSPRRQVMIPRNSTLPARKSIRFRTHKDNQANVKVEIVEGGDDRGTNATAIGRCVVEDLPPKTPKGTDVDVRFDYAQDGRLTVSASLPSLHKRAHMTLNRAAGLSPEEFDKWKKRIDDGLADPDPADSAASQAKQTAAPAVTSDAGTPQQMLPPPPIDSRSKTEIQAAMVASAALPTTANPFEINTSEPAAAAKPAKKLVKKSAPTDTAAAPTTAVAPPAPPKKLLKKAKPAAAKSTVTDATIEKPADVDKPVAAIAAVPAKKPLATKQPAVAKKPVKLEGLDGLRFDNGAAAAKSGDVDPALADFLGMSDKKPAGIDVPLVISTDVPPKKLKAGKTADKKIGGGWKSRSKKLASDDVEE